MYMKLPWNNECVLFFYFFVLLILDMVHEDPKVKPSTAMRTSEDAPGPEDFCSITTICGIDCSSVHPRERHPMSVALPQISYFSQKGMQFLGLKLQNYRTFWDFQMQNFLSPITLKTHWMYLRYKCIPRLSLRFCRPAKRCALRQDAEN